MNLLAWKMIRTGVNNRANGFLILLLSLLILYSLQSSFHRQGSGETLCDERLFAQIEGDIRSPGVYSLCLQADLMELIGRGGGLNHNICPSEKLNNIIIPSGVRINIIKEDDGWIFSQGEMSAFYKFTLRIPISVNGESEEGLTAIPGIGPKLANVIVRERSKRGRFKDLNEIKSIDGIGNKLYEKIVTYAIL